MNTALGDIGHIKRETLGGRVYVEIRDLLAAGELAPGERLSLRRVAETLGVSVMPVREAVTRLVADDALEVLPNRAVRVPEMTRDKFRELTTVRIAIEGFAAGRAAKTRSAEDIVAIQAFEVAFRRGAAERSPNASAVVRANRDFHFAVYAAAGLPALTAIIEVLWLRIGPVLNLDLRSSPERLASGGVQGCHAHLAQAVEAGDEQAARQALTADIEAAAAFIERSSRLPEKLG